MLIEAYFLAAINMKTMKNKPFTKKTKDPPKLQIGNLVLLKNHETNLGYKVYAQLLYL